MKRAADCQSHFEDGRNEWTPGKKKRGGATRPFIRSASSRSAGRLAAVAALVLAVLVAGAGIARAAAIHFLAGAADVLQFLGAQSTHIHSPHSPAETARSAG